MDLHPAEIVIAIQIMQSAAAMVLAGLLLYFFRSFPHAFLHHWASSSLALAIYLGTSAAALAFYWAGPEYQIARFLCSCVSLGAAYPHVVWLMIGTWEATRQKVVRRRVELAWVGGAAILGVVSATIGSFDTDSADLRNLVRVELRYLLTGLAFLGAGVLLWRAQRRTALVGARIGAIGFGLFGLQMLHVVGINLVTSAGYMPPFYFSYVGLIDFLFQSIIALGIVVWLLELQQQRTRRAHSELEHARLHDPATGLPNRQKLIEKIAEKIAETNVETSAKSSEEKSGRPGIRRVAVVSLGIIRFTMLSRALGWQQTERIVREISERILQTIGQRCALGRVSDRDLVVVRSTLDDTEQICDWTRRLLGSAIRPLEIDGQEIFVTFCAGVSVYPDDAGEPQLLLQHSQHALVQAAQIGRDVTLFQQIEQREHGDVEAALRFESELRRGLAENQFEVYYQPIVAVGEHRLVGFEALLRWRHPVHGVLEPSVFLDQAAGIGILDALESFVLTSALAQLARWDRQGMSGLKVAVNVSARRFQHDDLVEEAVDACAKYGVSPSQLDLEITENTALRDLAHAVRQIEALHAAGIRVALDDFGTGYSSLANLIKLPVDRIKLDQAFLKGVSHDERPRELVAAMILLGHRLGLEVVAEGVESAEQLAFLVEKGCDLAQGYLIQRPAAPEACRFQLDVAAS